MHSITQQSHQNIHFCIIVPLLVSISHLINDPSKVESHCFKKKPQVLSPAATALPGSREPGLSHSEGIPGLSPALGERKRRGWRMRMSLSWRHLGATVPERGNSSGSLGTVCDFHCCFRLTRSPARCWIPLGFEVFGFLTHTLGIWCQDFLN